MPHDPHSYATRLLTLATLLGALLLGLFLLPAPALAIGDAPAADAPAADAPAAVLQHFLDARNRGDVPGTLALLTDDIVFAGGPGCTAASPCVGLAAARVPIMQSIADHLQATGSDTPRVSGTTVQQQLEVTADSVRAAGSTRIPVDLTVEVRDGKLARHISVPDASDPQTARYLAAQRTNQPPAPGPMPGLPNTGGGGLAAGANRRGDLAFGLLALVVGLGGLGIRARRSGR